MRHAGEPTVEEILESIKKVIARDTRADADEQRRKRETQGVTKAEAPSAEEDEDDVLDLAEEALFADEFDAEEAADVEPESPLLNDGTRTSMQESLAALAMLAQPGVPPQIVRSGETSLEGMVRDLLRPALAEWLDKNLPQMVESMVAAEIARIVGKKG